MKLGIDDYLQLEQELPDIRADLKAFVAEIKDHPRAPDVVADLIEGTEHARFISDICEFLILGLQDKTNTVVIYGASNAGKTQFLNRLNEIFNLTYYMQTRSHFDC